MLRPAVAATNWASAGISGLDMREGGLDRVSLGPGWDATAKVPARAGAVNDGQGLPAASSPVPWWIRGAT
ncbi:hypothetical protein BJ6T_84790 [Bradyrhizobium japonicum USDA 6]|nr:hypothetical protein BJ6T_84790 [Bradyrhizobium japonicum USDA 6]